MKEKEKKKFDYSDCHRKFAHINFVLGRKPIYKFLKRGRMEKFFETGQIRLGTLHDFRNTEQHGNHIGDVVEGKSTIHQHVAYANSAEPNSFIGQFVEFNGGEMWDCRFIHERDSENAYTYCASHIFSEEGFRDWHEKEGLDACFEIFDPLGFRQAISKEIFEKARYVTESQIVYVDGDIPGESNLRHIPSAFIKQTAYAWQTEYRWLWEPRKSNVAPIAEFPTLPDPRRFCRKIAILEDGEIKYLNQPSALNSLTAGKIGETFPPTIYFRQS
jgi:hypothetical protein